MNKFGSIILLLVVVFLTAPGWAAVSITPSFEFARYGNNTLVYISYTIPDKYHSYANVPGGTGLPTKLTFTLQGQGQMPILYPAGTESRDIFDPQKKVNTYTGDIHLLGVLPPESSGKFYAAAIDMLLCSNRHCMPYKETFTGNIPSSIPWLSDVKWQSDAKQLLTQEDDAVGTMLLEEGKPPPPIAEGRYSVEPRKNPDNPEQEINKGENAIDVPEDFDLSLIPVYGNEDLEIYSLGKALILGLIAGLLLNAMPCVLPVLTLKVTGLLLANNIPEATRIKSFRAHNLCFAAGIISFFTILAFLLGAADMMWGQLYQNQLVLLLMLLIVFLMGLSMLGVFTLPALDLKIGANTRNPMLKSFITGFISTFLATPCSGPLLGGVLAWAFTQPLSILLAIFIAVGMGMALPYIAFSIWPNMARILPRPGNWMYIFEHILGFLLLGTAIYLFTILPQEKHTHILITLLIISAAAWLWGKFCGLNAPVIRRRIYGFAVILLICGSLFWIMRAAPPQPDWQNFSPQEFLGNLGKKNMLVEFTADWCPNCKFLEATVLSDNNLHSWQKNYGLDLIRVDLTNPNPYGQRLLEMLGSKSIPLTAIFAKGPNSFKPLVLRDIYGQQTLARALNSQLLPDNFSKSGLYGINERY